MEGHRSEDPLAGGRSVAVGCAASPELAWDLLATPARWPEWAPLVRRVTITRGDDARPPLLTAGQLLVVHGPGPLWAPVRVTRVDRGRRWDWAFRLPGPWRLQVAHLVEPLDAGCRVRLVHRLDGPAAAVAGFPLLAAHAPLARRALRRLAHLAEAASAPRPRPPGTRAPSR